MNVTVLADASHCPKTKAAGYGFWIASARGKLGGGGPFKMRVEDNNTAEMLAVCNALYIALDSGLVQLGDEVLIQTDCESAIRRFNKEKRIRDEHPQAKMALAYFLETVVNQNLTVEFRHVKGHTGKLAARYVANDMCDRRAKQGMAVAKAEMRQRAYRKKKKNAAQTPLHTS